MGATLVVIAVGCGLTLMLLAIPVRVLFRFQGIEALSGRLTVRWMFGWVRFRIRVPGLDQPQPLQAAPEPKAPADRAGRANKGGHTGMLAVIRQSGFRRRLYRLVKDLVRAAHLQRLRLRLRLGLGDPADTGRLWALLGPLNALAQDLRDARVELEPEFMDPAFEFEARGRLLLIPLQILAITAAFALSPPSIRAWLTLKGRGG